MEVENPWEKILIPTTSASPNSSRVAGTHIHDFWWAVNHNGQPGLLIEFRQEVELPSTIPNMAVMEARLSPNRKFMTLFLLDREVQKKFRILCHDLINESQKINIGEDKKLIETVVLTIARWQKLLEVKKIKKPSLSQKIGLLGELYCLSEFLAKEAGFRSAVDAWQGPKGHEQDFTINGHLIEVKAQLSSSDRIIKINSLEQLDTVSGKIWLQHIGLSPTSHQSPTSVSINSLIKKILAGLAGDNFGIDIFVERLECQGFGEENEFGDELFTIPFKNSYTIADDFPKITRASLGNVAFVKANYSLNMSDLNKWLVSEEFAKKEIFA